VHHQTFEVCSSIHWLSLSLFRNELFVFGGIDYHYYQEYIEVPKLNIYDV